MKNLIKSIIIMILIALPIFAAEERKDTPSTKDAFMSLVLEKAKLYSDKAESAISKSVDVVIEQAPIVAKEYLEWNYFKAAVNTLFCLFVVTLGFILSYCFFYKWTIDGFGEYIIGGILFFASVLFIAIPLKESILEMVKIKVAPRVYLIESTYDYVKNRK